MSGDLTTTVKTLAALLDVVAERAGPHARGYVFNTPGGPIRFTPWEFELARATLAGSRRRDRARVCQTANGPALGVSPP